MAEQNPVQAGEEPATDIDKLFKLSAIWLFYTYWPSVIAVIMCACALPWSISEYPGNLLVPGLAILLAISAAHVLWALGTTNRAEKGAPARLVPRLTLMRAGAPAWVHTIAAIAQITLVTVGIAVSLEGMSTYFEESEYPEAIWLQTAILFVVGLPLIMGPGFGLVGLLCVAVCYGPVLIVRGCRGGVGWLVERTAARKAQRKEKRARAEQQMQMQMRETKAMSFDEEKALPVGDGASTPRSISTLPSYHSGDPLLQPGRGNSMRTQSSAASSSQPADDREVVILGHM